MARRYPKELHDFIRENVDGRTARELTAMVNEKFNVGMTESQMKSYKQNHKLKSGTPGGLPKGYYSDTFPEPVVKYIQANYVGVGNKEMAERLNKEFGTSYTTKQLNAYYKNHGLHSGLTGRFEKGHEPANKGKKGYHAPGSEKGWFKKGHAPQNKTPIGTIHQRGDGYLWEKFGPGPLDWKPHHQLVWERAYGPQPEGHVIIFKDSDKTNCSLDNLELITMAESLEMTRSGLRSTDPDHTETGLLIVRVKQAGRRRKKKLNKEDTHNGKEELPHD